MTDTTHEGPLVTFAVFAYNQEQYIREAVEGAFAQTYEPLEIILSDDCSSDRTFEIIQEMAATYDGPHAVLARQSSKNIGTLAHLLNVAREAKGVILVVSAGDDISKPERTSILSAQFTSHVIAAVSSDDIVIDEGGKVRNWQEGRIENRNEWHKNNPTWVLGASAAYRSDLLKSLPLPQRPILHEDTVIQEILATNSRVSIRLQNELIWRRSHAENVSFKAPNETSIEQDEEASLARWKRIAEVNLYCAEAALHSSAQNKDFLFKHYKRASQYLSLLASWPQLSVYGRIKLFSLALCQGGLRTCLPRLFGRRVFVALKKIKITHRDL